MLQSLKHLKHIQGTCFALRPPHLPAARTLRSLHFVTGFWIWRFSVLWVRSSHDARACAMVQQSQPSQRFPKLARLPQRKAPQVVVLGARPLKCECTLSVRHGQYPFHTAGSNDGKENDADVPPRHVQLGIKRLFSRACGDAMTRSMECNYS